MDNRLEEQLGDLRNICISDEFMEQYQCLVKTYGIVDVILGMQEKVGAELVSRIFRDKLIIREGEKKRIGSFFLQMGDGGSELVISRLLLLWEEMGLSTILFTDEPQAKNSPPVPKKTEKIVFCKSENGKRKRLEAFDQYLTEYPIDCMVYHAWMSEELIWDIMLLHAHQVPVILYVHGVFSSIYYYMDTVSSYMHRVYRMCDEIVCLSEASEAFFRALGCRTFLTCNPLDERLKNCHRAALNTEILLWVGRISVEKAPMEALRIFREVHQARNTSKLIVLGTGNPQIEAEMQKFIDDNGLRDCVEMPGYKQNTDAYYSEASVYLTTSAIEGFQYTILESQAHGVPCVMYELPYLQLVQGAESCISIAQGDYLSAARETIRLLENDSLRLELGRKARERAEEVLSIDMKAQWEAILERLNNNYVERREEIYLYTLLDHMMHGIEGEREKIRNTRDYRVGHRIVELPRRIKRAWKSR